MSAVDLQLSDRIRAPAASAEGTLVLLHGRGADELDLASVGEALDPGRRLWIARPRGPLALPPGGAHWYVVPRVGFPEPASFRASLAGLGVWLEQLGQRTGVGVERTVIGGFSQGAVMSYALALGRGRPRPAGLIALSGFIPRVKGWEMEIAERAGLPVAIGHGALDPVIGAGFARDAVARLRAGGIDPLYRESPMGHGIDPRFVAELREWLGAVLGA